MISLVFITLALVLIRILAKRLLDTLLSKGTISASIRDIVVKIIDISIVVILISSAILIFLPQYWGIIGLLSVLAIIMLALLYIPLKSYLLGLAIQLDIKVRGKFHEIILPGYRKVLHGKVARTTSQHVVIQDVFGNEYMVRNEVFCNSILTTSSPHIELRLKIKYTCNDLCMNIINTVLDILERFRHPLIKTEKKIMVKKYTDSSVVMALKIFPINVPVRIVDIVDVVENLMQALREFKDQRLSFTEISIDIIS
ncbi:MAG: hypothetical protein QXS23_02555 [Desulfurococcaceae archaeon]